MLKLVTSECYRLLAATIAATAGQVFHCPESRSDSRARTELPPPAHSLGAHYLGFASLPSCPQDAPPMLRDGWRDGVSGSLLTAWGGHLHSSPWVAFGADFSAEGET